MSTHSDESVRQPNTPPYERAEDLWIVYGLLENRATDHDLRFIEETTTPQRTADEHPEYEACMAFPKDSACQIGSGTKFVASPVAMLMGACWPNAAERAGR